MNTSKKSGAATEKKPTTETSLVVLPTHQKDQTGETPVVVTDSPKKPISTKEILDKHGKIARCIEKLESIDQAAKALDSFNLGRTQMGDKLAIRDAAGNTFETTKTDLISDVISLLKQRVEVKTTEVEAELLQLEIAA